MAVVRSAPLEHWMALPTSKACKRCANTRVPKEPRRRSLTTSEKS